jgi:hypothetical protein
MQRSNNFAEGKSLPKLKIVFYLYAVSKENYFKIHESFVEEYVLISFDVTCVYFTGLFI